MIGVYRVAIANIGAADLAAAGQAAGLQGSIWAGFGFGAWGVEPTTFLETVCADAAGALGLRTFLVDLMVTRGEQAVYLTVDGADPFLLWADGRVEVLGTAAAV